MFKKNNKATHDYTALSVKELLKYIQEEVIILQNQIIQDNNEQDEAPVNELEGTEAVSMLVIENFLWELLLGALFGGTMIADMFTMLAGDDFEMFLGGLSLLAIDNDARSQRLQAPFILSMYPKGRKTFKTILKNINSSHMRGSASKSFMTPAQRRYQLAVLNKAEQQLRIIYGTYFISHIGLDARHSIASNIDRALRYTTRKMAYA